MFITSIFDIFYIKYVQDFYFISYFIPQRVFFVLQKYTVKKCLKHSIHITTYSWYWKNYLRIGFSSENIKSELGPGVAGWCAPPMVSAGAARACAPAASCAAANLEIIVLYFKNNILNEIIAYFEISLFKDNSILKSSLLFFSITNIVSIPSQTN